MIMQATMMLLIQNHEKILKNNVGMEPNTVSQLGCLSMALHLAPNFWRCVQISMVYVSRAHYGQKSGMQVQYSMHVGKRHHTTAETKKATAIQSQHQISIDAHLLEFQVRL